MVVQEAKNNTKATRNNKALERYNNFVAIKTILKIEAMLSKKEIKYIQSLGSKKNRDEFGVFLAEGPKIVAELLQLVPGHIEKVWALKEWITENKGILKSLPVEEVASFELQKISQLQTPNQVVCVVKQQPVPEPDAANNFCLYLDAVQDPGNFGTIMRIADWFGIAQLICSPGCADVYNPKVVQSTMASIARVKVYYDVDKSWLTKQQVPVYAAVLNGKNVYEHPKVQEGILIIGNESKGIDAALQQLATHKITIPKKGAAESLNAAVATGIILSHLVG